MTSQFIKPTFNDIITTFINSEYQKMFNVIDNYQLAFPLPDGLHLLKQIRNCFVQDVCVLSVNSWEIDCNDATNLWTIEKLFPNLPKYCFRDNGIFKLCDKSAV